MSRKNLFIAVLSCLTVLLSGCAMRDHSHEAYGALSGAKHRFRIALEDQAPPKKMKAVKSRGGKPHVAGPFNTKPVTAGEEETIIIAPYVEVEGQAATHKEEGGATPGDHCHYWVEWNSQWYQVHC